MLPTLRPGDRILVLHGAAPARGRLVVARFPDGTTAVKRAAERRDGAWWLLSDNAEEGTDSRHRGAVPDAAITAVVLLRVWPRPRPLRGV